MSSKVRRYFTGLVVVWLVGLWGGIPAQAHGGDDEAGPVDLVEQALAILVNTPEAVDEVLERIEEALVEEAEASSGELDLVALEQARSALEVGELHDAEDALVAALGQDPHPDEETPGSGALPVEPGNPPPDDPATGEEPVTETPEEPASEEKEAAAGEGEDLVDHGLTTRVEGGFVAPDSSDVIALAVALLLLGGGVAFLRGKGEVHDGRQRQTSGA